MEPVPGTRAVRRTVRVAVALVVGQALLCALIGWMTFGPSLSRPAPGPAVDQVAGPPVRKPMPTEEFLPPPPPAPPAPKDSEDSEDSQGRPRSPVPSTSAKPAARAKSPEPSAAPRNVALRPPPAPPGAPSSGTPSGSATGTPESSSPPGFVSPRACPADPCGTPSPSEPVITDGIQWPVTAGNRCHPEGAFGRTMWGTLVRCVRDGFDRPRWKIV